MSKKKTEHHTSKSRQRRVVQCLAEQGAQTINEAKKNMKADYKATYQAFQSLEKQGIIEKVSIKKYKNQEFSKFWLTREGIINAVVDGQTNLNRLVRNIEKLKGKNLSSMMPFIGLLKDAMPTLRPILKDIFVPLFKKYGNDLNRKASDDEMQGAYALLKITMGVEDAELKAFFESFMKLRNKVKGSDLRVQKT